MQNNAEVPNLPMSEGKGTDLQTHTEKIDLSFLKKGGDILLENINAEQQALIGDEKRKFTARELRELAIQASNSLIHPIFPQIGLIALVGGSDTGKSMLLRQLAFNIVGRKPEFLGFPIYAKHFRALCILTEDDPPAIKHLLSFQADDVSSELLDNLQFIFSPEDALKETEDFLKSNPTDLVVVDSWGDASGVDPKDNGKVRIVLNEWHKLAIRYKCLIVFLHHTGKTTDKNAPSKHNTIGAQSFEAKVRCMVELRKDAADDTLRHFCIVKANGLSSEYKNDSYVLDFDQTTFKFTNTGSRRPFDELASFEFRPKGPSDAEKYETAIALINAGKTHEEIAPIIGFASKGSVSKLIARMKDKNAPF